MAEDSNIPPSESAGVLGDGALHPGKHNMRLVERAIRNDWPIDENTRRLIIDQMSITATQSEQERNRIAASRVLVAADGVNVKRESLDLRAEEIATRVPGDVNINIGLGIQVVQREDFYGNAERLRAIQDRDAAAIPASVDDPQELGAVQTPGMRETVGQDGDRSDSGGDGARADRT